MPTTCLMFRGWVIPMNRRTRINRSSKPSMFFLLEDDGLRGAIAQVHVGVRLVLLRSRQDKDKMYLSTPGEDGGILGSIPDAQARFLEDECREAGCGIRFAVNDKGTHDGVLWVQVAVFATDGTDLEKQFVVARDRVRVRAIQEIRRIAEGRALPREGGGFHE